MTRINLIEPKELTDKHLLAEYRELPRIFTNILKKHRKGKRLVDYNISSHFVLGTGHEIFFYNKVKWLERRFDALADELLFRGFDLNHENILNVKINISTVKHLENGAYYYDYRPRPEDVYLSMYRISTRHFGIPDIITEGKQ